MEPYIGIVRQEDGSACGVAFPDAPGRFSAADTLADLFTMAEEALGSWLEGASVPRDLSVIRDDPNRAESFRDAVLVIAVLPPSLRWQTAA